MPFHGHHHSASSSHQPASTDHSGTATSIYQAAQALGAIGAPAGNLRGVGAGTTSAGTDAIFSSGSSAGYPGAHPSSGAAGHGSAGPNSASAPAPGAAQMGQFDPPRRTTMYGRQPEELHMHSGGVALPSGPHGSHPQSPRVQQHAHAMAHSLAGANPPPPQISLQQAAPQNSAYIKSASGVTLPGVLQPGGNARPGPLPSSSTAPATVPTMLQIQTQNPPVTAPAKSANINPSHGYSRSSPAGAFDSQRYVPYPGTPDAAKFNSPSSQKYTPTQSQQAGISNSPLGLADIRPSGPMGDGPTGANPYLYEDEQSIPTNSNYVAPWATYALDWCKWSVHPHSGGGAGHGPGAGKIALGSYLEDGHNYVGDPLHRSHLIPSPKFHIQILDTELARPSGPDLPSPGGPTHGLEFTKLAEASSTYPVTRILWEPPSSKKQSTDLLATSGDHLRLWSLPSVTPHPTSNSITVRSSSGRDSALAKLTPLALLSNSKSPEHTAPLTSLDWNTLSPSLIITSSIDTTCTIWDIPTLTAKTQLIAHDKEVFDVRFCANSVDVFVSCGADGSVRMFDLRSLEHSTIIYEPSEKSDKGTSPGDMSPTKAQQTMSYAPPLLRISTSPHDAHLLATFAQDSSIIRILDVRQPGQALLELRGHAAPVNSIEWSPSRRGMLASGADDSLVLLWDLLSSQSSSGGSGSNPPTPGVNGIHHHHPHQGQSTSAALAGGSVGAGGSGGGATAAAAAAGVGGAGDIGRRPIAAWQCEYEVNNISWAPPSLAASYGGDWVGVCGGRGVWGVKL